MTDWHTNLGVALEMLKGETVPTRSDLEAVLYPDDQQEEDEVAAGSSEGAS